MDDKSSKIKILEAEFKKFLIPRLKEVVNDKNALLFCISDLNTHPEISKIIPIENDLLFARATLLINIKMSMFLEVEGSLEKLYVDACKEYNFAKIANRRSPKSLAIDILSHCLDSKS